MALEKPPPLSPSAHLRMGIISRIVRADSPGSVIEVGPGLGAAGWLLAHGREYRAYEPDREAFRVASARLASLPNAEVYNEFLPREPEGRFDAVLAFEVLEHIEDDEAALVNWREWLTPGGMLLISVPAKQKRFGPMDYAVGHYRRYERAQLTRLLQASGFDSVDIRSYGMPLGYVLEWLRNRVLAGRLEPGEISERTARSGRSFQPQGYGALLRVLIAPFRMMQRPFERTDFGTGYVVRARAAK